MRFVMGKLNAEGEKKLEWRTGSIGRALDPIIHDVRICIKD